MECVIKPQDVALRHIGSFQTAQHREIIRPISFRDRLDTLREEAHTYFVIIQYNPFVSCILICFFYHKGPYQHIVVRQS